MEEGQKTHRISNRAAILLIGSAVIADLLTLIPFVGIVVGPIYWVLANIYFLKSGFGFMNSKRLATSGISAIAEVIPVIQELPTVSVAMIVIVVTTRIEDKTGISVGSAMKGPHLNAGGVRRPTNTQQPLNQGGSRQPNGGLKS